MPNNGGPEKWGVLHDGEFRWHLNIKPEPSFREGLDLGSQLPRFDARLDFERADKYINPFTGEVGTKEIGRHVPLENQNIP